MTLLDEMEPLIERGLVLFDALDIDQSCILDKEIITISLGGFAESLFVTLEADEWERTSTRTMFEAWLTFQGKDMGPNGLELLLSTMEKQLESSTLYAAARKIQSGLRGRAGRLTAAEERERREEARE